jgi:hypothetical protein
MCEHSGAKGLALEREVDCEVEILARRWRRRGRSRRWRRRGEEEEAEEVVVEEEEPRCCWCHMAVDAAEKEGLAIAYMEEHSSATASPALATPAHTLMSQ